VAVGITVKVTVMGATVVLVRLPLISPVPLAGIPVTRALLSLVQVYVVPGVTLLLTIVVMMAPEQLVCEAGVAMATGVWLTVTL